MRIAILSGVLFLSGCSALIFETLWLRLSGLTFGNSVWSAALILSSFMAGLALGTAIAASSKVRRVRPLRLYALLEIAIALVGCTIVFCLPHLGEWMRPLFQALWNHEAVLNGLRFFLSFAILLVPTTAMGLTLPIVLEDEFLSRHEFGRAIGFLYGWNTLGAVAGALIGEAYLVAAFGLWGTSLTAGLLNCAAAAIALFLALAKHPSPSPLPSIRGERIKVRGEFNDLQPDRRLRLNLDYRPPWKLLLVSFGAGCILLTLEIVWFRFLRLYVASSSTAFAIMLAVVLAGIGLGGVAFGALPRRVMRSNQWLPILLMAAAITTLLCYLLFPTQHLEKGDFYLDRWREIGLLSLALMFPVAFLSGILFPAIAVLVQESVESRMNSVGITTLFNTTGAAIGPLLASFVLLPGVGFQWTLILCAACYTALAIFLTKRSTWLIKQPLGVTMLALCATLILIFVFFPYERAERHFANARRVYVADGSQLLQKVEGTSDTLQLLRRDLFGEPYYYRLVTNAFTMSDTRPINQRYMRLFAYLPLALRPESKDALLIAYGCGITADALAHDSRLQHIDVVDISKEVFDLAEFYRGTNYSNPLRDPRVSAIVQDGRFFLQASPRQYDLITGEPPPPKVAGSVNLYTEEFFSLINARLKESGIATFWLPISQLKVDETKAILRAFHNAFPNASVWAGSDYDWIMLGIKGPGDRVKEDELREMWRQKDTATDLTRIGMEIPEQLAALFLMDGEEIDRITNGVKPLTDFYPKRLSDALADSPSDLEAAERFAWNYLEASPAAQRFVSSPLIERIWPPISKTSLDPVFATREMRHLSRVKGSNKLAELDFYLRNSKLRAPVLEALRSDEMRVSIAERVASKSPGPSVEILPDLVAGALAQRDFESAIRFLEDERAHNFANRNDILLLTYLYCLSGNVDKAEALAGATAGSIEKDWFVDWLWAKLQTDFRFHPPR
jgi:spermidine synthase